LCGIDPQGDVCSNVVVSDYGVGKFRWVLVREWCFFCCCPYQVLGRIHATRNRSDRCLGLFALISAQQLQYTLDLFAGKSSTSTKIRHPMAPFGWPTFKVLGFPEALWSCDLPFGKALNLYIARYNVPHTSVCWLLSPVRTAI